VVPHIAVLVASVRDADYSSKWKVIHWKSVNTTAFLRTFPVVGS
jgi:hypothetical protein